MLPYFFIIIEYGEREIDDPEGAWCCQATPLLLNMRGELSTISGKIAGHRTAECAAKRDRKIIHGFYCATAGRDGCRAFR